MTYKILSQKQVNQFKSDGVLLLTNFYNYEKDIMPIQLGIYNIIGLLIKRENYDIKQKKFNKDNFDSGYLQLIHANRSLGEEIYDAVKQIPAFVRLSAHPNNEYLIKQIFNSEMAGIAAFGCGIRIDNPEETQYRANWHQEFLSQLRSRSGIILWSPLLSITPEVGPVELCLGSHLDGVFKVTSKNKNDKGSKGAYALRLLKESERLKQYNIDAPLSSPSDVLLVDWLLLHRSGLNNTNRPRWSMQMRYFDFTEPSGIKIGWRGSFAAGSDAKTIYPEYFVD